MMKVEVPVEAGNKAIKDGSLPEIIGKFVEAYKPEAAYFVAENGNRMATFVFNMDSAQDLPSIAEPFFQGLNARIWGWPCMDLADMKAGVAKASQNQ